MNIMCLCILHARRRLSFRYGLIWGLLEDEWLGECCWTTIKGTFCFHEFTPTSNLEELYLNVKSHRSEILFTLPALQSPPSYGQTATVQWDVRFCPAVTPLWMCQIPRNTHGVWHSSWHPARPFTLCKNLFRQSGPTARAGLTSLHSAQKAEQLAANQFEPLRTIHNHAPQREF